MHSNGERHSFQHDVSQPLLRAALDGTVQECVSFVGVDINICSETLMRYSCHHTQTHTHTDTHTRQTHTFSLTHTHTHTHTHFLSLTHTHTHTHTHTYTHTHTHTY